MMEQYRSTRNIPAVTREAGYRIPYATKLSGRYRRRYVAVDGRVGESPESIPTRSIFLQSTSVC
jgi:hypothetical protein